MPFSAIIILLLNHFFRFQKNKARILILGLDNAGKTTMLYKKKLGVVVQPLPTLGFNYEKVEVGKSELQSFDPFLHFYWQTFFVYIDAFFCL